MTRTAWRIVKRRYARPPFDPFSGAGAKAEGGRWNSPGRSVVYCAESIALAALEVLVNIDAPDLIGAFALLSAEFDEGLVTHLDAADLPSGWRARKAPPKLQRLGDEWLSSAASTVLRVPSAVIEGEFNYLLNPAHPDFQRVVLSSPRAFRFDPRLRKS